MEKPRCPSTDDWIMKMWLYTHTHTHTHYIAIKYKEILPFAKTWIEFEDVMLSEISQTEEGKYSMISLIWGIQGKQTNK